MSGDGPSSEPAAESDVAADGVESGSSEPGAQRLDAAMGDDADRHAGSATDAAPRPIYNVPFAWDSSHGHVVELLVEHAQPGLIVDVGCGYAPHAERLRQRGFGYVGVDADPAAVAHLHDRGFVAAIADADDPDALVDALDTVTSGLDDVTISAVLALDVLEHLVTPHLTLDAIAGWMDARSVPLLGVSLPNVTHDDVVLKLMTGRLDMTPSGLLDHTHLRFFTNRSVSAMLANVGMRELARRDVVSPTSDQDWPEVHPALSDGALLGSYLRRVRALSDEHGATFQFVRLFTPVAEAERTPTLLATRPAALRTGITALVAPSCSDELLGELAEQFDTQRGATVDVVRVVGGRPADDVFASIDTTCVAFLRGDECFAPGWAAQLLAVADRYPAAVVRCAPLSGADAAGLDRTVFDVEWAEHFSLFDHYLASETPGAALLFPTAFVRELSTLAPVLARAEGDWTALTHALLLEAAPVCGVVETGTGAVAPRSGWRADDDSVAEALQRVAAGPSLAPSGSPLEVAKQLDQLRAAHAKIAELEGVAAGLRDDVEFLNAELAKTPVRATRKILSVVDRAAARLRRR